MAQVFSPVQSLSSFRTPFSALRRVAASLTQRPLAFLFPESPLFAEAIPLKFPPSRSCDPVETVVFDPYLRGRLSVSLAWPSVVSLRYSLYRPWWAFVFSQSFLHQAYNSFSLDQVPTIVRRLLRSLHDGMSLVGYLFFVFPTMFWHLGLPQSRARTFPPSTLFPS